MIWLIVKPSLIFGKKSYAYHWRKRKTKEKHLNAKERVLNEQEAELTSFRAVVERKGRDVEARLKLMEDARIQQLASVKATTLELSAQNMRLNDREANIAYQEQALTVPATALEQFQRHLAQNHECS
ncbi:hypothetical protein V7S43_001090 [Phytophthora oleae]|uniref:Uncharacterized protein n=1 Tax=Phytophthora oleae TaxID=2107226 RepID=A0ABD3G6B2_9STRA